MSVREAVFGQAELCLTTNTSTSELGGDRGGEIENYYLTTPLSNASSLSGLLSVTITRIWWIIWYDVVGMSVRSYYPLNYSTVVLQEHDSNNSHLISHFLRLKWQQYEGAIQRGRHGWWCEWHGGASVWRAADSKELSESTKHVPRFHRMSASRWPRLVVLTAGSSSHSFKVSCVPEEWEYCIKPYGLRPVIASQTTYE